MQAHRIFAITLIVVALAACATTTPEQQASFQANVPVCLDAHQCEGMWAAARNWVPSHCGMKIQTMSDSFIETFTSTDTSTACRVTKDPIPQGGYAFSIFVSCGNMFGCVPTVNSQIQDFQATVNQAGRLFGTAHGDSASVMQPTGQAPAFTSKIKFGIFGGNREELPPAFVTTLGGREIKGTYIVKVVAGSIADAAGVKPGDDLYEIDGQEITSQKAGQNAIANVSPGRSVSVKVLRNGVPVELTAQF